MGPMPRFAAGDLLMTVTDNVVVRSAPRVSADSIIYGPALHQGTTFSIVKGPEAGSGYWWYRVRLEDDQVLTGGITVGWVAAADHDGEPWIDWVETSTDPIEEPDLPALPDPDLEIEGARVDTGGDGRLYTYFDLAVVNWADYPVELFAPAPELEPCGLNKSASRTWVGIVNAEDSSQIYGFCGLAAPEDLVRIWFAVPFGSPPPSGVYVEIWDRLLERSGVSNTVVPPWPLPSPLSSPTLPPTPSPIPSSPA